METNELTSIDDKLVDTSTIQTTSSIHSLLNIENRVAGGCTEGRIPAGLVSQGALPCTSVVVRGKSLFSRILEDQFSSPCPCPRKFKFEDWVGYLCQHFVLG